EPLRLLASPSLLAARCPGVRGTKHRLLARAGRCGSSIGRAAEQRVLVRPLGPGGERQHEDGQHRPVAHRLFDSSQALVKMLAWRGRRSTSFKTTMVLFAFSTSS